MSIDGLLVYLIGNLLLAFVNQRFLAIFFEEKEKNFRLRILTVMVDFGLTSLGFLIFHRLEVNILTNMIGLMAMTMAYQGKFRKKILAVLLIYILNMACDVIVVLLLGNSGIALYDESLLGSITVMLIALCETTAEKANLRKYSDYVSPHDRIRHDVDGDAIPFFNGRYSLSSVRCFLHRFRLLRMVVLPAGKPAARLTSTSAWSCFVSLPHPGSGSCPCSLLLFDITLSFPRYSK